MLDRTIIITFTSTSGLYGNAGQSNYSAAKSGIAGFTKVVALDLGRYGVTVNSVAPMAGTRMTLTEEVKAATKLRQERGVTRDGFGADAMPDLTELKPDDVAPVVVYLASDAASDINGQVIYSAGGVLSLVQPPRPIRTIHSTKRWTVEELIETVPGTLMAGVTNPAPPQ